ncbi:MAG: hypothetical protein ACI841_004760, partial [Planctomycetota bacterium]
AASRREGGSSVQKERGGQAAVFRWGLASFTR